MFEFKIYDVKVDKHMKKRSKLVLFNFIWNVYHEDRNEFCKWILKDSNINGFKAIDGGNV